MLTGLVHYPGEGSEGVSVPGFNSVKELIKQLAGRAFSPPQHRIEPLAAPAGAEVCRLSQGHRLALAGIADAVTTSGNPAAAVATLTQVRPFPHNITVPARSASSCTAGCARSVLSKKHLRR